MKKLLIVDDDVAITELMKALVKMEGFESESLSVKVWWSVKISDFIGFDAV